MWMAGSAVSGAGNLEYVAPPWQTAELTCIAEPAPFRAGSANVAQLSFCMGEGRTFERVEDFRRLWLGELQPPRRDVKSDPCVG